MIVLKKRLGEILIVVLPVLVVFGLMFLSVFLIIENARLDYVNGVSKQKIEIQDKLLIKKEKELEEVKGDLVIKQNEANGYIFDLNQLSNPETDYIGSDDE